MKETIAGDHFVLNPEQKEFTLTAEDDTQAVVYEGVAYKNERLLYQNYVVIPRQNRELVEELKTCFPEDIPPGGGSPDRKSVV